VLENFSFRYRKELPLILNNINLRINAGDKVGIVGRTGAGKSSIIQSLLRMYEPEEGSVYRFGNYDALELGVHTLRKRISVIPQVPFIYRKSIRLNLDPFLEFSDAEVWRALDDANLANYVKSLP
jgi:ABC-type multidrug transport system fused ATPase/permease subunit